MWEIIVIIARHIQTYMNAELFFARFDGNMLLHTLWYNSYRLHLVISKTKKLQSRQNRLL